MALFAGTVGKREFHVHHQQYSVKYTMCFYNGDYLEHQIPVYLIDIFQYIPESFMFACVSRVLKDVHGA